MLVTKHIVQQKAIDEEGTRIKEVVKHQPTPEVPLVDEGEKEPKTEVLVI